MTDKLLECYEAFKEWRRTHIPPYHVSDEKRVGFEAGWRSSRSAFAAELVRRLEELKIKIGDEVFCEDKIFAEATATIRQMAGEK